jgi:hypothetical protein
LRLSAGASEHCIARRTDPKNGSISEAMALLKEHQAATGKKTGLKTK